MSYVSLSKMIPPILFVKIKTKDFFLKHIHVLKYDNTMFVD